jgi:hypothetical protein
MRLFRCQNSLEYQVNPFLGRRFAYELGDAKEQPEHAPVPDAETFENRKKQARGEIDAIYESGKYDTYNFRTLPQAFKDRMRDNFGQWIDANIAKYDKDKNSGINAAEYAEFKNKLNEKVTEILDRLIEVKEQKKKQAEQVQENAEQAQEAQKRLEGIDTSKINEANLDTEDGCYTELLSYQKDFEKETEGFAAMAKIFSGTKNQIEEANKAHYTGATAFGEMLVSWVEDIPEVKAAKAAKEKAVADFRAKLAEMKKRQQERQARGAILNGAPEKIRGRFIKQYEEEKNKTRKELNRAKQAAEENKSEQERLQRAIELNEDQRKAAQAQYDKIMIRLREAERRKAEVQKRTGDMREAVTGFEATAAAARKKQTERGGAGAAEGSEEFRNAQSAKRSETGKMSAAELERQAGDAAIKARAALSGLETGLNEADKAVGDMDGSAMIIQRKLADMNTARKSLASDLAKKQQAGTLLNEEVSSLNNRISDLDKEEQQRIEYVDELDATIAETVIQVDTSNFELIKQGEEYLKMLSSLDVSGPGLLDTAGAMIKGIPGVETAYNWSGDKLSNAWQWAQRAPVLGAGIEIVGYMGEGWVKAWDAIGEGLSWLGDKMHLGEAWDWMSEASKHLSIGNPTGNAVVDAILDTLSGGGLGTIIEVFAGVTEGAKDLVQGVGMMLQHPFDTIKGLGALLNHPGKIIEALIQKDKWSTESTSKIIGRALFDVITTLTGAGATAISVKTALIAMKLGGLSAGKALLLALKTFPRVLAQDIGKMIAGAVKLPATMSRGLADLFQWIARGGRRLEPIKTAGIDTTTMMTREQTALRALDSVKDNPAEFLKWLEQYPDQIEAAYKMMQDNRATAQASIRKKSEANRQKEGNKSDENKVAPPSGEKDDANAEEPTRPDTPAAAKSKNESTRPDTPAAANAEESTRPATRKAAKSKAASKQTATDALPELEEKNQGSRRIRGDEPITPADMGTIMRSPEQPSRKKLRRTKNREETREAMTDRLMDSERRLLERRPDYNPKPFTNERMELLTDLQARLRHNKAFAEVQRNLLESLRELRNKHAAELAGISPSNPRYSEIKRAHIAEEARMDAKHLLEVLPDDELEMLRGSLDNLDETLMLRVLQQDYNFVLDTSGKPVRIYIGNAINHGTFGMVHDVAYVIGTETRLRTGAMKRPRDMASLKADSDYSNMDMASMNALLNSIEVNFYNEQRTFSAIRDFNNSEGLLRPRVISNDPRVQFIIYDKIDAGPGEPVRLKDRITRGDNPEEILRYAVDAMDGERNLAENGWFHLDIKAENIFVGRDENGVMRGYLGDLSLNNVDDVAFIRLIEVPSANKSRPRNFGVLKVDRTDFSRSVQIGTTPGYFSFDHVNKSFEWVKNPANAGKPVPEEIMALAGNHAFAVTLERIFKETVVVDGVPVSTQFAQNKLPITNRQQIIMEVESLITRLKDPDSGIDIRTRQSEFRRIQQMIEEARDQDSQMRSSALNPTG